MFGLSKFEKEMFGLEPYDLYNKFKKGDKVIAIVDHYDVKKGNLYTILSTMGYPGTVHLEEIGIDFGYGLFDHMFEHECVYNYQHSKE